MSVMDNLLVSPRHHPGESLLFGWINRSKSKTFEKNTIELAEKNLDIVGLTHLKDEKAENLSRTKKTFGVRKNFDDESKINSFR